MTDRLLINKRIYTVHGTLRMSETTGMLQYYMLYAPRIKQAPTDTFKSSSRYLEQDNIFAFRRFNDKGMRKKVKYIQLRRDRRMKAMHTHHSTFYQEN